MSKRSKTSMRRGKGLAERLISVLLVLTMVLAMGPGEVWAADVSAEMNDAAQTETEQIEDATSAEPASAEDISTTGLDISKPDGGDEPEAECVYKAGEGTITFTPATDTEPATLTLNNASIATGKQAEELLGSEKAPVGLKLNGEKDWRIVLEGVNTFSGFYNFLTTEEAGERKVNQHTVTITGTGSLVTQNCRQGIHGVDRLVIDGAKVEINALEYGIYTYGEIKVINDADVKVCTSGRKEAYDGYNPPMIFYTNCALLANNGGVEVKDSNLSLTTPDNHLTETYTSFYNYGLWTQAQNTEQKDPTEIVVNNSTLNIEGFVFSLWNMKGDIAIKNGSTVSIKSGSCEGKTSHGIGTVGLLQLSEDSKVKVEADRGLRFYDSASAEFGGTSSVEVLSEKSAFKANGTVAESDLVGFDSYAKLTDAEGNQSAAYEALVNPESTAEGAVPWRHDGENAELLTTYKYVRIGPKMPTVTYITDCDTKIPSREVAYGDSITAPQELTKDGYAFGGWYQDAAFTKEWKFEEQKVENNVFLYAKWVKTEHTPDPGKNALDGHIALTDSEVLEKVGIAEADKANTKIFLTVEDISGTVATADKNLVKGAAGSDTIAAYLDVKMFKRVGTESPEEIHNTKDTIRISLVLPDEYINTDSSKTRNYCIIRVHEGVAEKLSAQFDPETNVLTFATNQFSTYAIVYNDTAKPSTPSSGSYPVTQKPVIVTDDGAEVKLDYLGTTAEIIVKDGFKIKEITLNDVPVEVTTKLTGLKTGDKVVITTVPESESAAPADNEHIIKGVQDTCIKIYSLSKGKASRGKGWIRIWYEKSPGYKADYYEVFRSKGDKKHFGKTAFYKTKKNSLTGWYKNTKNVKKGNRYYYKIRGVRVIDGKKYYTKWSNTIYRTGI